MAQSRTAKAPEPASKPRESEVLAVAARVFHARGYAASSVQSIADELGILKGSVYYYISSKEDLLYRILKGVHDELGAILEESRSAGDDPPLQRLHDYVYNQTAYAARNISRIAIYYRDADQLSAKHQREILRKRQDHQEFVTSLILHAQELNQATSGDPHVLSNLIFGSFIWSYRWYRPRGPMSPDELATTAAAFAVRAIAVS